jgi:hypothetical protein
MPENSPPTPAPAPRRTRVPLVVAGTVTALFATGVLAVGGVALWADGQKDADGYLSTSRHQFTAQTAALATKNLDINLDGAHGILDTNDFGKVRLKVTSTKDKPVFVGIARSRDVNAYLRRVAHTTLTDVDSHPFEATYRNHAGRRSAATRPADRHIWAASTQGRGTQTLRWRVKDGEWSVVVMNADGSPGVRADITAGAKVPFLKAVGWSTIGGGILLAGIASAFFALGIGRRPTPPAAPAADPVPAAS